MFNNDVGSKPLDKFVEVPFKAKGTSNKERIKEIQELSKPVFNLTWDQAKAEYNRMNKGKILVNVADQYHLYVYPIGFNPPFGKYPSGFPWEDEEESNA